MSLVGYRILIAAAVGALLRRVTVIGLKHDDRVAAKADRIELPQHTADGFIERGDLGAARTLLLPIEAAGGASWRDAVIRLATLDEQEGRGQSAIARWQHLLAQDIDDERAWAHLRRLGSGAPARGRGPT